MAGNSDIECKTPHIVNTFCPNAWEEVYGRDQRTGKTYQLYPKTGLIITGTTYFQDQMITIFKGLTPDIRYRRIVSEKVGTFSQIKASLKPVSSNYPNAYRLINNISNNKKYLIEVLLKSEPQEMEGGKTGKKYPPVSTVDSPKGTKIYLSFSLKPYQFRVWDNVKKKTTKWEGLIKSIELGHELIHCLHHVQGINGSFRGTTVDYIACETGKKKLESVIGEEAYTIGTGAYKSIKSGKNRLVVTENMLRQELAKATKQKIGVRIGYMGRDPSNGEIY